MTTPNMGLTEPTDHGSSSVWGSILNSTLDLIDAHDHTTGKGVKVPSAGLNINADVSWASLYAAKDLAAVDFTPVAATSVTGYSSALFANSSDSNNLYFRNSSGVNVQITSGSTLNVSIVGGIGGDYSSIGALLDYDDASDTYRFRQQNSTVRQYAKVTSADLNLFEYKAAGNVTLPTNAVTLKSPSALAGSYTLTMPAALPAATYPLQVSSSGVLSAPTSLSIPTLTVTTAEKFSTIRFATIPLMYPVKAFTNCAADTSGNFSRVKSSAINWTADSSNSTTWGMRTGDRLQTVTVVMAACGAGTYTVKYKKTDGTTITDIDSWTFDGTPGSGSFAHSIATPEAIGAGYLHWIQVNGPNNTPDIINNVDISWDRP